ARAVHMGSGRSNPGHTTVVPEIVSVGEVHASGHREVVQLGQGLWFHRPGRRLGRRLRPPLHHQDRRLPYPSGEPAGRVHRWPRPEGPAGGRSAPAVTRHDTSSCGAVLRDRPAVLFTGLCHRAGDGDEAAVGQVGPGRLGRVPGQLDAAQALVPAVAVAREVVHGVAAVEIGDVLDRVGVLASVRVGSLHDLVVVPQVHRECFFFNDTATTEIYTLSLHDALPI